MLKNIILLRTQLLIAFGVVLLTLFPSQSHELLRIFAEDFWFLQSLLGFVALITLALTLWLTARWLTILNGDASIGRSVSEQPPEDEKIDKRAALAKWSPRICGAAPIFALGVAMFLALWGTGETDTRITLIVSGILTILLGFAFLYWTHWRTAGRVKPYELNTDFVTKAGWQSVPLWAWLALFVFLFILLFTVIAPVQFPQWTGTYFFVYLFVAALTLILTMSNRLVRMGRSPIITIAILLALLWSLLDTNDNHRLALKAKIPASLNGVEQEFEKWLSARADRALFDGKPYPVFIVAAKGGGSVAAYRTALFLSKIQDECPGFASHLFAISGVSGGSVGVSVFADLLNYGVGKDKNFVAENTDSAPCKGEQGNLVASVDRIFAPDLLSPVLAKMLFAEPVQAVLPFPIPAFDQAKSLEDALVKAVVSGANRQKDYLRTTGVARSWKPTGAVPALVLNSTETNVGLRAVDAPFSINAPGLMSLTDFTENYAAPDIVESAFLSSRFPFITAPGSIWTGENAPLLDPKNTLKDFDGLPNSPFVSRFVDGGYYENSGVATALDLIEDIAFLNGSEIAKNVEVHLIVLSTLFPEAKGNGGLNELRAPFQTLLSTRGFRGRLEKCRAEIADSDAVEIDARICGTGLYKMPGADRRLLRLFDADVKIHYSVLDARTRPLPLGWRISRGTRKYITQQVFPAVSEGICGPNNVIPCNASAIANIKTALSVDGQ